MSKQLKKESENFYEDPTECKIPYDSFTAASNGDLSYFTKYVLGTEKCFSEANKSGWTPIMYACARGHALLVSYLIMCGVKTSGCTKSKVTPLMLAITSGDFPTVECVFKATDLERTDYRMWTALFYAVHFSQEKCVEFLLEKGANVNITDFQNETPLIIAVKTGSEKIVDLITKTANNLDTVSYKNESAIMLAKESQNHKICDIVLNRKKYLSSMGKEFMQPFIMTPQKKISRSNKENLLNVTPSPIKKNSNLSFLGLKINRSFTYSPNSINKSKRMIMQSSPVQPVQNTDLNKMALWKMCVATSPVPAQSDYNVEQFLRSLGLEKYWPTFRDEEVDFETLLTFSEENLKEIGITHFGPRKKILFAICQFRLQSQTTVE